MAFFTLQYKTTRSSELRAILAKARAKVEATDDGDADNSKASRKIKSQDSFNEGNHNGSTSSYDPSPRSSESPDSTTKMNTKMNAGKARPALPRVTSSYNNNKKQSAYDPDYSDDESDSDKSVDGRSTLGRMLRKKRGEILNK